MMVMKPNIRVLEVNLVLYFSNLMLSCKMLISAIRIAAIPI
jgi:hypothetical protein